jgi:hypothetical protein
MRPTGFRMAGHNHSLHIDPSLGKYNGTLILTASTARQSIIDHQSLSQSRSIPSPRLPARIRLHEYLLIYLSPPPDLYVNRHKFFRWTPRTAWITFAYVVLVPGIIGTIGYKYDVGVPLIETLGCQASVEHLQLKGVNGG